MKLLPLSLMFLSALGLHAHNLNEHENHFFVEIIAKDSKERSKIANLIHVDNVQKDRIFSVVNSYDFNVLTKTQGINLVRAEVIDSDKNASFAMYNPFKDEIEFPAGDEIFHTYQEVEDELRAYSNDYPEITEFFSIGKTHENRDIWAIKLGNASDKPKPAIVFMATHHAREHVSTEIPMIFLQKFLESSDTDLETKQFLDEIDIYIIPVVNPDGAIYDIKNKNYKWWRKNRRNNGSSIYGVDLNRNYGYQWGTGGSSDSKRSETYMGPAPFSEPETAAIRDFFASKDNVTIALSFHTYSELILYPWSYTNDSLKGKDKAIYEKMANDMANMNNYTPMQSSDLYVASGETCDYLYNAHSIYCFTFELSPSSMYGGGFYPGASIIDQVFDDNYGPMQYLLRLTKDPSQSLKI